MTEIRQEVESIESDLVQIRRTVHENPELGFLEFQTAILICNKLDELEIPYKNEIAKTGIVATLEGGQGLGKRLLIRADMDALPLLEETGLPFKSKNKKCFHACGHDSHVACLLGVAQILKKRQKNFKGTVKFVFQPAEESSKIYDSMGSGGATPMIQEGAFGDPSNPDVDAALALHVVSGPDPEDQVGKIAIKDGPFTGSADEIYITVIGKGGHASAPQNAVDPIYIASQIYISIQGYLTRAIDPMEPVVFTVGKIEGGSRFNIIPKFCKMEGTLRTLNEDLRTKIKSELPKIISNIAQSFGANTKIDIVKGYPVGINHKEINDHIRSVTNKVYGESALFELKKAQLGAEDFYDFSFNNKIPIAMFWLGGSNKSRGMTHANHSNYFDFDEKALVIGTTILTETALSYLNAD